MIEFAVFAAVCCLVGGAYVIIRDRRQDVLHGGYIEKKPWHP